MGVAETKHLRLAAGLALATALNVPLKHDYNLLGRGSAFGIGGAGRPVPGLVYSHLLLKHAGLQYTVQLNNFLCILLGFLYST